VQPERPVQTTLAFHSSRIVIDVGVLLALAAMSLPFVVSDLGDRSAVDADALPALLLMFPIFLVTLIPDHTRPIHPIAGWVALAFGLAALPYSIVKLLDAGILADTLDGSLGFGAYLLIIGVIIAIAGIGIGLYRNLRGLPTGGTPGRSKAYTTRSSTLRAPGTARPQRGERKAPSASQSTASGEAPVAASATATAESSAPQPEIIAADAAPAREAADDPSSTAERADAAIDDHIMAMFDEDAGRFDGDDDEAT
jgi:hypothetical protein